MPASAADIYVDERLVRALLVDQHPDLAGERLRLVGNGWDNAILRLGDRLAVRMPRRRSAAELVRHEQQVLPVLAPRLPVAVPVPVRIGRPSALFPWAWSVVPWFEGATVAGAGLRDDIALAEDVAAFLAALHRPAPLDVPSNPVRGVPLAERASAVEARFDSGLLPEAGRLRALWAAALAAPRWAGRALWLHGDLHPANLLQRGGRLTAVIDFGDVTAGDPATDLATAWLTFGPAARARFRVLVHPDAATWSRARGWALCMAGAMFVDSEPGTVTTRIGRAALAEVLLDD